MEGEVEQEGEEFVFKMESGDAEKTVKAPKKRQNRQQNGPSKKKMRKASGLLVVE